MDDLREKERGRMGVEEWNIKRELKNWSNV